MTWVVGIPWVGLGVLMADVRITVWDPNPRDVEGFGVLKLHPITPSLCLGFSGNLRTGFGLVDDLRDFVRQEWQPSIRPEPNEVIESWVEALLTRVSLEDHDESRLMVVGVSPSRNTDPSQTMSWPLTLGWIVSVTAMETPVVEPMAKWKAYAIGSGGEIYRDAVDNYDLNDLEGLRRVTQGSPGLLSHLIGWYFSAAVVDRPAQGVSPHVFTAVVTRAGTAVGNNLEIPEMLPAGATVPGTAREFPPIARSWDELLAMASRSGLSRGLAGSLTGECWLPSTPAKDPTEAH